MPVEVAARQTAGVPSGSWEAAGPRRLGRDRRRHPLQRLRGAERQHPREAASGLRPRARRPHLLVPGPCPPALGHAPRRHPEPDGGGALLVGLLRDFDASTYFVVVAMVRPPSRWPRSSSCGGAFPTRRAVPHARLSVGSPALPRGNARGLVAIVRGACSGRAQLLAAHRTADRGRRLFPSTTSGGVSPGLSPGERREAEKEA
jgi:hypothetical protein